MIKYSGFTKFAPVTPEQVKLADQGVCFICDETGRCWYDIVKELADFPNSFKVVVDANGYVTSMSKDASALFPIGCDVVVVSTVPSAMEISIMRWKLTGTTFTREEATTDELDAKKTRLMNDVTSSIQALQDAVEAGVATDDEKERLATLKAYRLELYRIDTSTGGDVVFPELP